MELILNDFLFKIEVFIVILVRISSLFIVSPLFGRRNVPNIFKIGFSAIIAIILVNIVEFPAEINLYNTYELTIVVLKEFVIGLILGYVSFLIFSAIYFAGQIIDMQIGFGIVNVMDPISNIQVPITSNLYYTLAMVVFLTINGHHMLIQALTKSYNVLPIGTTVLNDTIFIQLVKMMQDMFIIGFKISAPIIAAVLVCDVALGILARTMPQMNIFIVGLPLKITLGLAVILITLPAFSMILGNMIDMIDVKMTTMIKEMIPK